MKLSHILLNLNYPNVFSAAAHGVELCFVHFAIKYIYLLIYVFITILYYKFIKHFSTHFFIWSLYIPIKLIWATMCKYKPTRSRREPSSFFGTSLPLKKMIKSQAVLVSDFLVVLQSFRSSSVLCSMENALKASSHCKKKAVAAPLREG